MASQNHQADDTIAVSVAELRWIRRRLRDPYIRLHRDYKQKHKTGGGHKHRRSKKKVEECRERLEALVEQRNTGPGYIRFAEEFIHPILEGEKTATVRYDTHLPPVGAQVEALSPGDDKFAQLEITSTATVKGVEAIDVIEALGGEHGAGSPAVLVDGLNEFYDDAITLDTTLQVIVFDVVERGWVDGK